MNFALPLPAFEPHIAGARMLIDLCRAAPRRPALLFASSVAVAARWDTALGSVPEETLGAACAAEGGYGAAKCVVEQVRRVVTRCVLVLTCVSGRSSRRRLNTASTR